MIAINPSPRFLSTTFVWFAVFITVCKGDPDPTDGFTAVPLDEDNFKKQWPYNVDLSARYSFEYGIRRLWVYSSDKPFKRDSDTKPRTEIRMTGYDYSDGIWQFEGYGYVPNGTTGVSIMQIFGADNYATSFMLHVYDGQLMYYNRKVMEHDIYERWFRLNVIHTVGQGITVFIDGIQKYVANDRGGKDHYFKFGVYMQEDSSYLMESSWRDVKIYNKS
ncbi:Citrate-binding protein [Rhynchospora pubera]|uniref:Citrate-binding protein n=2 Tax=Rhynchospora pubera TaxID=906938 RepID=A0AAV8FTY2_9POAL|nr:Citrate-binding protein [Rhynchospora pubera]KAJ4795565.1 Citrate-binding protein [Rhynchospora pubera]KAJ4819397.1 Citrate-binding protein [Rhynchospora pubera]